MFGPEVAAPKIDRTCLIQGMDRTSSQNLLRKHRVHQTVADSCGRELGLASPGGAIVHVPVLTLLSPLVSVDGLIAFGFLWPALLDGGLHQPRQMLQRQILPGRQAVSNRLEFAWTRKAQSTEVPRLLLTGFLRRPGGCHSPHPPSRWDAARLDKTSRISGSLAI